MQQNFSGKLISEHQIILYEKTNSVNAFARYHVIFVENSKNQKEKNFLQLNFPHP